jgi:hypothetical protein
MHQLADRGYGNACEAARHLHGRRSSEEELVVFATVERELDGPAAISARLQGQRMDRQSIQLDLCPHAGGAAEVGQVGGEAVTEVNGGRRQMTPEQSKANVDARLGKELGMCSWFAARSPREGCLIRPAKLLDLAQLGGGATERTGDVEQMAGTAAAAA